MKKIMDLETALLNFEVATVKQAESIEKGDTKLVKKYSQIILNSINFLKKENQTIMLVKFLNHPSIAVRIWAASRLLPIREEEAISILENIIKMNVFQSFDAKLTLKEWRKGNLKF
jgi:hypothetical protein